MSGLIPPLGTKGRYEVASPYSLTPNHIYTCGAIRYFKDVANLGIDVFKEYYEPYGLSNGQYATDLANNVAIVTLLSTTIAPVYIPSSYITAYPDLSSKPYKHIVLIASLGMLPDSFDLTFAKNQVAQAISDVVGTEVTVNEASVPVDGVITPEQHEILTANREAAIVNRETDYAKVLELEQRITELQERNAILEKLVLDNGLLD